MATGTALWRALGGTLSGAETTGIVGFLALAAAKLEQSGNKELLRTAAWG